MSLTSVRRDEDSTTTIEIVGALDVASSPKLADVFEAVVSEKRREVTLELSALEHIDRAGIAEVIALMKRLREHGGVVRIVGLRGQPRRIFSLARLDRVFPI